MTIEALGAWGDFIGGIAVLAGLVFVGIQLIIANRESRLAANQKYAESLVNVGTILSTDSELALIYAKGLEGIDNLEGPDRVRFVVFMSTCLLRTFENMHSNYIAGRLEESVWNGTETALNNLTSTKGFQEIWELRRSWFNSSFQVYIDQKIAGIEDPNKLSTDLLQAYGSANEA